jgi:hypothetical protein
MVSWLWRTRAAIRLPFCAGDHTNWYIFEFDVGTGENHQRLHGTDLRLKPIVMWAINAHWQISQP